MTNKPNWLTESDLSISKLSQIIQSELAFGRQSLWIKRPLRLSSLPVEQILDFKEKYPEEYDAELERLFELLKINYYQDNYIYDFFAQAQEPAEFLECLRKENYEIHSGIYFPSVNESNIENLPIVSLSPFQPVSEFPEFYDLPQSKSVEKLQNLLGNKKIKYYPEISRYLNNGSRLDGESYELAWFLQEYLSEMKDLNISKIKSVFCTGKIDDAGNINRISNAKEKYRAAKHFKFDYIFFPADNKNELESESESSSSVNKIIYCNNISEFKIELQKIANSLNNQDMPKWLTTFWENNIKSFSWKKFLLSLVYFCILIGVSYYAYFTFNAETQINDSTDYSLQKANNKELDTVLMLAYKCLTSDDFDKNKDKAQNLLGLSPSSNPNDSLTILGYLPESQIKINKDILRLYIKAEKGSKDDAYELGNLFYYGNDIVKRSPQNAFTYFLKVSDNYASAAKLISNMYMKGEGTAYDYSKGLEYAKLAVKQGDKELCEMLGRAYYEGNNIERNASESFKYYSMIADKGITEVDYRLGIMYEQGSGTEKDYKKALDCYEKAADSHSFYQIAHLYEEGLLESDNKEGKAIEYYLKTSGYKDAYFKLGCLYNGKGDSESAIKYFELVSNDKKPIADNFLGTLYMKKKQTEKALNYFKNSASAGCTQANYNLGYIYFQDQDYEKARKEFEIAATTNNSNALCKLGEIYECGYGVDIDHQTANYYYKLAAELGNATAKKWLIDNKVITDEN